VKDHYNENYKTLKKEMEKTVEDGKTSQVHGSEEYMLLKLIISSKIIYRFNAIPYKIPMKFFTKLGKKFLKFIWKHKRPQIAKAFLSKKSSAGVPQYLILNCNTEP
jgi:hypothetical protein